MIRKPLVGATVGLLLGFVGALVVVQAVKLGGPSDQVETVVGSPDVNGYCSEIGPSFEAMLQSTDAFGWRCIGLTNRTWDEREVAFNEVCAAQFGVGVYASVLDEADPMSWRCVKR